MILSEIRTRVLRLVGDENSVVFTSPEIADYVNEGFRLMAEDLQCLRSIASIAITDVNGYVTLPADFIRLVSIRYGGLALPKLEAEEVRGSYLAQATGVPSGFIMDGFGKLLLYPITISGTGLDVSIHYVRYPADISLDAAVSEMPTQLHINVVYYALYRCYQRLNDNESAAFARTDFDQKLAMWRSRSDNTFVDSFETVRDV